MTCCCIYSGVGGESEVDTEQCEKILHKGLSLVAFYINTFV